MTITARVKDYWEASLLRHRSHGPTQIYLAYFEEIEEFRYHHEPHVHLLPNSRVAWEKGPGGSVGRHGLSAICPGRREGYGNRLTEEAVKTRKNGSTSTALRPRNSGFAMRRKFLSDNTLILSIVGGYSHAEEWKKFFRRFRVVKDSGTVKIWFTTSTQSTWYTFFPSWLTKFKRQWVCPLSRKYGTKACHQKAITTLMDLAHLN